MFKSKKKLVLLIAGALCAAGIVIGSLAFVAMGFDIRNASLGSEMEQKEYSTSVAEIQKIDLYSGNAPVIIQPSTGDEVRVHYQQNERYTATIKLENGTLSVVSKSDQKWYDFLRYGIFNGLNEIGVEIILEVPADYAGDLIVKSSNGTVDAQGLSSLGWLEATSSNGRVDLKNMAAADIKVHSSNGTIHLSDVTSKNSLYTKSSNGRIDFANVKAGGITTMNSSNGSIKISDSTFASLDAKDSNGKISLINVTTEQTVSADSRNGSVEVQLLKSPDIILHSSNGTVSGTIDGIEADCSISTQASNGSSNLDNRIVKDSQNSLKATTSNGSIRLDFTQPE